MPPKFLSENFRFDPENSIPDHIEGEPRKEERHPQKIWLQEGNVVLAIDVDGWHNAQVLQRARFRELEETGQQIDGVFIRLPGETE